MPEDAVLLRAASGPWTNAVERTASVPAEVVLYRDGTVLANVSPVSDVRDVRAVRLEPAEVDDILERIAGAAPEPLDLASSFESGCYDAGVQVIHVRSDGQPLELAVYCLDTRIPIILEGVPESAVTLSRILDELERLAAGRPTITTDKAMPLIPAAPHTGG